MGLEQGRLITLNRGGSFTITNSMLLPLDDLVAKLDVTKLQSSVVEVPLHDAVGPKIDDRELMGQRAVQLDKSVHIGQIAGRVRYEEINRAFWASVEDALYRARNYCGKNNATFFGLDIFASIDPRILNTVQVPKKMWTYFKLDPTAHLYRMAA